MGISAFSMKYLGPKAQMICRLTDYKKKRNVKYIARKQGKSGLGRKIPIPDEQEG